MLQNDDPTDACPDCEATYRASKGDLCTACQDEIDQTQDIEDWLNAQLDRKRAMQATLTESYDHAWADHMEAEERNDRPARSMSDLDIMLRQHSSYAVGYHRGRIAALSGPCPPDRQAQYEHVIAQGIGKPHDIARTAYAYGLLQAIDGIEGDDDANL